MADMRFLICTLFIISFVQITKSECNLKNGKCVYDMKIGQPGKCDSFSSGGKISGSCTCDDVSRVNTHMNAMKHTEGKLRQLMDELKQHLDSATSELNSTDIKLQDEKQKSIQLHNILKTKESLLNQTKVQLTTVLQSATVELSILRGNLGNQTRALNICQTAIGTKVTQSALSSDITTFYCGFEQTNLCHFTQDRHENGDWTRRTGSTSSQTGPRTDHTYGNRHGYYMVLQASSPVLSSSQTTTARLTSQSFSPAPHYCVRFWYTMYGSDVKTFNVYAKVNGGLGYPVYTRTGNLDREWHLAEISLGKEYTGGTFQVVFEATHNSYRVHRYSNGHYYYDNHNQNGNIALDDVYIYNTSCSSIPTHPAGAFTRQYGNMTSYYTFHGSKSTWYDAVKTCKEENIHSNLATVTDATEQQYLVNRITSDVGLTAAGQNGFYLNGNDEDIEGSYKWTVSGYPVSLNYTNWHVGQPNNVGNNQDCLLMEYPESSYEWGDVMCSEPHAFICEMVL